MTNVATQFGKKDISGGTPAWEVATLFPNQGNWCENDYFTVETNHPVELVDGHIEVFPMQTIQHQRIVLYLLQLLSRFVSDNKLGEVAVAPLPVRLRERLIREPDILFIARKNAAHATGFRGKYPDKVDLVIEVVSEDAESQKRDWQTKKDEYAAAGIAEYWIVDPHLGKIVVHSLNGSEYREFDQVGSSGRVASELLEGFAVNAEDVFAAALGE